MFHEASAIESQPRAQASDKVMISSCNWFLIHGACMNRFHRKRIGVVLCLWPVMSFMADGAVRSQEPGVLNPVAQQALSRLSMTLERPLFAPSRHKSAPPAPMVRVEAPPPPPPAPPKVELLGIMKNNQDIRAVLRVGSTEKVLRVHIGDEVGGWKIAEIAARRVTLSLDDRTTSVALFENHETKRLPGNGRNGRGQLRNDDGIRGD
jgi:hypothetical protein